MLYILVEYTFMTDVNLSFCRPPSHFVHVTKVLAIITSVVYFQYFNLSVLLPLVTCARSYLTTFYDVMLPRNL